MKSIKLKFGIVSTLSILGTFLFYNQFIGLNTIIYTLISISFLFYLYPNSTYNEIINLGVAPIFSSCFIMIYPQALTFWVWIFSIIIMWSKAAFKFQFLLIPFHGLISLFLSPWIDFADFIRQKQNIQVDTISKTTASKTWIYFISISISLVFAILYISSNPIINDYLDEMNLEYFDTGWFAMALFFFMLTYGLIFFKKNEIISKLNSLPTLLTHSYPASYSSTFQLAKITFSILIVLISIVNLIDLSVIITGRLPQGITYSEYVHQGFNTLIFSLSLAVALLLYFFKSDLNFHQNLKTIKTLSFIWIINNLLLASITAYKNLLYVQTYGFTYLRIAVFFGLICAIIALILAHQKINNKNSNWLYINALGKHVFIALFLLSLFPIDYLITQYNLKYAQEKDVRYLSYLDKPDIILLLEHQKKTHPTQPWFDMGVLQRKLFRYQDKYQEKPWPSYCLYYESLKEVEPY